MKSFITLPWCPGALNEICFVSQFELMLNIPVNIFSVILGCFPRLYQFKAMKVKSLAEGHNTMSAVGFRPAKGISAICRKLDC